jgi:hypothetical protein
MSDVTFPIKPGRMLLAYCTPEGRVLWAEVETDGLATMDIRPFMARYVEPAIAHLRHNLCATWPSTPAQEGVSNGEHTAMCEWSVLNETLARERNSGVD